MSPIDPSHSHTHFQQSQIHKSAEPPAAPPPVTPPEVHGAGGHHHGGEVVHKVQTEQVPIVHGRTKSWKSHFTHMQNPLAKLNQTHLEKEMKRISKEKPKSKKKRKNLPKIHPTLTPTRIPMMTKVTPKIGCL